MRHLLRILSILLTIGSVLIGPLAYYSFAQPDNLNRIYINSAPEQFVWSADSRTFVFLGSTAQRGVEIAASHWYSYDVAIAALNPSSIWPLQPVLTSTEIKIFNPLLVGATTFMHASPDGRYVVYAMQDMQRLALGDRLLGQTNLIPDVSIPDPTTGPDQFRVLWSADSTALTVVFASAYSDEFGAVYVRGFTHNPAAIETVTIGASLIDGRAFRHLTVHDLSADGSTILLSGAEIYPNSDLPPSLPIPILWTPAAPKDGEIFDSLAGMIRGASFEADESKLLIVNELGLVRFDRISKQVAVLNSAISAEWVSRALFSPDAEHAALIHEDVDAGNKAIYVIQIADAVTLREEFR
jgi:hypothetical protein